MFGCGSLLIDELVLAVGPGRADVATCNAGSSGAELGLAGCCRTSDFESICSQFPSRTAATTSGISFPSDFLLFLGSEALETIMIDQPIFQEGRTISVVHYGSGRSEKHTELSISLA
ncbi:hypothetical protein WUBG_12113 [Wuchereria bancrofti]|uniref:Uncharacterized protein n=1 Tax=Wuchereria bancrofti TaxID=6293 RepID=J9EIY0_WUCBA|nr:hypothetical protein WUBG_12113 [Wuchereria bancrofti]